MKAEDNDCALARQHLTEDLVCEPQEGARGFPMAEANGFADHTNGGYKLHDLPIVGHLKNGQEVYLEEMDPNSKKDFDEMYHILKDISDEGIHYPFVKFDHTVFRKHFLTHHAFLLKLKESGEHIGSFYIKPFFPDRSAHLCNAGFGVKPQFRGQGSLQFMIKAYLRLARDLGYRGSYFTLVYAVNQSALSVYRKMGFQQVGVIPQAGLLKDLGYVDAYQFYYDLTTLKSNEGLET